MCQPRSFHADQYMQLHIIFGNIAQVGPNGVNVPTVVMPYHGATSSSPQQHILIVNCGK